MRATFPQRVVALAGALVVVMTLAACFGPPPETAVGPPSSAPVVPAKSKAGNCMIEPHTHCQDLTLGALNFAEGSLRNADFHASDLTGSDFRGADLRYADLSDADLRGANLEGALLQSANLAGADFTEANLAGANLKGAILDDETRFSRSYRCATVTPDEQIDDTGCPGGPPSPA